MSLLEAFWHQLPLFLYLQSHHYLAQLTQLGGPYGLIQRRRQRPLDCHQMFYS